MLVVINLLIFQFFVISDIDECSEGIHECHVNATCNNTQGSYTCTCFRGYVGNGKYCQNLKGWSYFSKIFC